VPNSHPIAANAKPEFSKENPFFTGHPLVRCYAQIAEMLHFGNFSLQPLMKRCMQLVEIHLLTKRKGRFPPFFLTLRPN